MSVTVERELEELEAQNCWQHLYLMITQKTKAVVMLNRVMEKESVKCAQYWPTKNDQEMLFRETGFNVKFLSEDVKSYYTVHVLPYQ
ncbi:PREDICTED: tyrosine-protein phosphatase non-receptor type 2-like [Elephantulus edwardii]|uniref:tyrosine-protein phosphatase non-receptor type 2-like n=1 Tax=Elephantulus edwardii TaxID=28737 RepID=UPI0003F09899|nr:PREDICTED: tyrosine-protein phosphatase non-receptor type 2-like [Elephantulus edwardii]